MVSKTILNEYYIASKHIHLLGDVNQVANLKKAIWDANDLVLKLSK